VLLDGRARRRQRQPKSPAPAAACNDIQPMHPRLATNDLPKQHIMGPGIPTDSSTNNNDHCASKPACREAAPQGFGHRSPDGARLQHPNWTPGTNASSRKALNPMKNPWDSQRKSSMTHDHIVAARTGDHHSGSRTHISPVLPFPPFKTAEPAPKPVTNRGIKSRAI
jgi:hypothetical protein